MIASAIDPDTELVANRASTVQYTLYRTNRYFHRLLDPLFTSAALLYAHEDPDPERHTKKLQDLLARGAKANIKDPREDNKGATALHYAAKSGNQKACEVLLDAGADINVQYMKDNEKLSPLLLAVRKGHVAVAEFLIDRKADVEQSGCQHDCITPLRSAIYRKDEPMLRMLLKKGADPNRSHPTPGGIAHPPLFYAKPANITRAMLEGGADPNKKDLRGVTVLHHFENHEHLMENDKKTVAAVLREYGAELK